MADITVQLVSVDRMLWSGQATMVTAETTEGEIGVLPGHEPLLGQLTETGVVTIHPVEGERHVAAVSGGFLSVSPDKVTILAEDARWVSELDQATSEREKDSDDPYEQVRAEAALKALRRSSMQI